MPKIVRYSFGPEFPPPSCKIALVIGRYLPLLALSLAACQRTQGQQQPQPLTLVADVPLPGGTGRFDYQSLDQQSGRLYIAHMGPGRLLVFDTRADRVLQSN